MTSWLFGRRNDVPSGDLPQFPTPPTAGTSGGGGAGESDDDRRKRMEAYRFDSAALEKAAKAAKDLESSSKKI